MANDEWVGGGRIAPSLMACGAGFVIWVFARRVRVLERQVDEVSRKAELARRNAAHTFRSAEAKAAEYRFATAVDDVNAFDSTRDSIREMICRAEAAARAYGPELLAHD